VPSLADMPAGCPFAERCPRAEADCRLALPAARPVADAHEVRCLHPHRSA
jgi:oligopeptide/dipeptide ABC transporter ATP-binding protein